MVSSRFWSKVNKVGPWGYAATARLRRRTRCWVWTGAKVNGYGQFWNGDKTVYAHVWAYEQEHGPVPPGLELDHLCRTRACVRPLHLEAVTHQTNYLRSPLRARPNNGPTFREFCSRGHNDWRMYGGKRRCGTCHNEGQRKRRAA